MRTALTDLNLQRLFVIHAGGHSFDMAKKIRAIALPYLLDELKPWQPLGCLTNWALNHLGSPVASFWGPSFWRQVSRVDPRLEDPPLEPDVFCRGS